MYISKLIKLDLKELEILCNSERFNSLIDLPISIKRFKSYINNPRKNEDSPLLNIIEEESQVVSYLGVFQDQLFLNKETIQIGWMSSAWTHPDFRRRKLLDSMIQEHYKDYGGYFMITNYGTASEKMFLKSGLFNIYTYLNGHRFYYRLNLSEILPPKSRFFYDIKILLEIFDKMGNFILDMRFYFYKKYKNTNIQKAEFNEELKEFISRHNQNSLFKRNVKEFKWILDYPWVEQRKEDDFTDKKYHFTTSAKRFYQKALVYREEGKIKGFLFYSVKNEILKIHYLFVDSDSEVFSSYILDIIRQEKISLVMLTDERFIQKLKKKGGFIYSKFWKKGFFVGKKLLENYPEITEKEIYMGDGDTVFT